MTAPDTPAIKTRPMIVTIAMWLQILLGLFLIAQAIVGMIYGADAQAAAEAELAAQGHSIADLPEGTTFESGAFATWAAIVPAALIIALAVCNGAGRRWARVVTWVVQPLVLICGGLTFAMQALFGADLMSMGIEAEGGPTDLDVDALFAAIGGVYPMWANLVSYGAFALATAGSVAVIVLLAMPAANAYFRKPDPAPTHIPGAPPA